VNADGYIIILEFNGRRMLTFTAERLDAIMAGMQTARVAVVGDLMLDRYMWGNVERISPEAPVPVVNLTGESIGLGGAANVAANVYSLGAEVIMLGVVGEDKEGEILRETIRKNGQSDAGIVNHPSRPTSIKTRIIAHNQHVVRIDRESNERIDEAVAKRLLEAFSKQLPSVKAVILEDYNKGVLSPFLIKEIIEMCSSAGVPVGVDPKHDNFWSYKGVTLFKPNFKELEIAVGRSLKSDEALTEAGRETLERLDLKYLLVTMGERGMALFQRGGVKEEYIPTHAHRVHDVSGAGDTVIATIMTALAGGADIREASIMATWAASIVIAEVGAVPVDRDDLRRVCLGR
jgi:rfaE bifunctional protein kinase chain/domain